jgi:hypothetical protein
MHAHAHADRDSRSVRRATAASFKRRGKRLYTRGLKLCPVPRLYVHVKVEGDTNGNPEARCKGGRVYGLKKHHYSILSLCNELQVLHP